MYRNATDFCILFLCPAIFLYSVFSSKSFLVASLGFSISKTMSFSHSDNFASLLIWVPFVSFSCLIALARTSNTVFNKRDAGGYPCLVPDLRGNAFHFSPLSMLAMVLSEMVAELCFLYTYFVESFYHEWILSFLKCFFYIY